MEDLKVEEEGGGEGGGRSMKKGLVNSLRDREWGFKGGRSEREAVAEARLVDRRDLECVPCGSSSSGTRSVFLTVFSPEGSVMASTHGDHNVYVIRLKDGECVRTLKGHPRTPWSVAFHPGRPGILASGCLGGHVRVWDYLHGGSESWETNCVITSLAFHPEERCLLVATLNKLYLWDWLEPVPFSSISTHNEKEKILYVKFDSLGHRLVTGIANLKSDSNPASGSRVYRTFTPVWASNNRDEEAPIYYRVTMHDPAEAESDILSRRRLARPSFYARARRRLSASQTLSDLAAAASSQLEAENAAAAAANASSASSNPPSTSANPASTSDTRYPHLRREEDEDEDDDDDDNEEDDIPPPPSPPRTTRRSRFSLPYPSRTPFPSANGPDTFNFHRRSASPFTHSPESSFVEVPGGVGAGENGSRPPYFGSVYSRFHPSRARRLREILMQRQSLYSRVEDLVNVRDALSGSSENSFGNRRIDEWAVNRRLRLARSARVSEDSEEPEPTPGPSSSDPSNGDSTTISYAADSASKLISRSQMDVALLRRHIEHMQQICISSLRYFSISRQRRQMMRLQAIRRMLEDLQSQIRSLRDIFSDRVEPTNERSSSQSTSSATALSINRRLHLTRQGLNRAMRRLNRSSNSTVSRRTSSTSCSVHGSSALNLRENPARISRQLVSRLRASVRAMEMSPDLSRSGYNSTVNELIAEESRAVMERTENTSSNPDDTTRSSLRAMSQRLERLIRENREASSGSNVNEPSPGENEQRFQNPEALDEEEEDEEDAFDVAVSDPVAGPSTAVSDDDILPPSSSTNTNGANTWSHLLDHGGYIRQLGDGGASSSDSDGDTDVHRDVRGTDINERPSNRDRVDDTNNVDESMDFYNWLPPPGLNRRWGDIRNTREFGRASMRERLDTRAGLRRDYERARQRFSRERDVFRRRRDRYMEDAHPGASGNLGGSNSLHVPDLIWRRLLRRNLQLNFLVDYMSGNGDQPQQQQPAAHQPSQPPQQQRPLHREILSWMVDQLTIDQQGNNPRPNGGDEPGLPTSGGTARPLLLPESVFRRRYAAHRARHNDGIDGHPNGYPNGRNYYIQQLRNHHSSLTHRLQVWDFAGGGLPEIHDREVNVIVKEAKIYNDASVDISTDGTILVTLCSSNLPMTTVVGVYGCSPTTRGQCYATYSLESTAVSVSLSPTNRHLLVGVSTTSGSPVDRSLMAQVFRIQYPWERKAERGRLIHHRDIHHSSEHSYITLNCIRWIPDPGQGIVYATNTGLLRILR